MYTRRYMYIIIRPVPYTEDKAGSPQQCSCRYYAYYAPVIARACATRTVLVDWHTMPSRLPSLKCCSSANRLRGCASTDAHTAKNGSHCTNRLHWLYYILFIYYNDGDPRTSTCVGIVESTVDVTTLRFPSIIVALVRWGIYETRGRHHLLYKHRTYIHLFIHIAVVII